MDLIDTLKNLSAKISKQKEFIQTEEATKNAFVMPFISALGYDVFDPSEVVPEFTADIGTKKGEKVDYAIIKDGMPAMFFECKKCDSDLIWDHASQLYRYFASTSKTRIGVLTNGIQYHFYADLDEANIMDKKPFLEFNMMDIQEPLVSELKKLTKSTFNIDEILSAASELKYMKETKRILNEMFVSPSEEFVKFFAYQLYSGIKTQKIVQQFTDIVKRSFNQFVNDKINERLKSAMAGEEITLPEKSEIDSTSINRVETKPQIETTQEEIESFYIVKSIVRDMVDVARLSLKDFKTLCNIVLDGGLQKSFFKMYYSNSKMSVGFYDENKKEINVAIESLQDIYNFSDQIKISLGLFLKS